MSEHKSNNETKSLKKNSVANVLDGNNLIQNNNYKDIPQNNIIFTLKKSKNPKKHYKNHNSAEISPEKFLNILNVTQQKRQHNVSQSLSKIHDKTQSSLKSPFLTSCQKNSNKFNFDNENLKSRKLSHQQIFLHSTYTQKEAKITDFSGQNPYKNHNQLSNQHLYQQQQYQNQQTVNINRIKDDQNPDLKQQKLNILQKLKIKQFNNLGEKQNLTYQNSKKISENVLQQQKQQSLHSSTNKQKLKCIHSYSQIKIPDFIKQNQNKNNNNFTQNNSYIQNEFKDQQFQINNLNNEDHDDESPIMPKIHNKNQINSINQKVQQRKQNAKAQQSHIRTSPNNFQSYSFNLNKISQNLINQNNSLDENIQQKQQEKTQNSNSNILQENITKQLKVNKNDSLTNFNSQFNKQKSFNNISKQTIKDSLQAINIDEEKNHQKKKPQNLVKYFSQRSSQPNNISLNFNNLGNDKSNNVRQSYKNSSPPKSFVNLKKLDNNIFKNNQIEIQIAIQSICKILKSNEDKNKNLKLSSNLKFLLKKMKNSENTYGEEMSQIYSLIYNLLFPKTNDFTQLIKKYNNQKKLNNIIVQDQNQIQGQNQDLNVNQDIQSLMNLSTYLTNNVNNGNSNSNISINDQEQIDLNQYVEQDKFNSSENMTYFHICQNFYSMIQQIQNENSQNNKKIQDLQNQLEDQKQINMQQKEQFDKQNSTKDQQINELEQTINNLNQELELRAQVYQKSLERSEIEQSVIAHELDIQKKEVDHLKNKIQDQKFQMEKLNSTISLQQNLVSQKQLDNKLKQSQIEQQFSQIEELSQFKLNYRQTYTPRPKIINFVEFFGQFEPKTGEVILDNKKSTQNKIDIIHEAVQRLIQNKQVELSELQEQKSPMKKTQILSNRGSIFSSKTNISPLHRMNSSNSPKKKQNPLSLKMEQVQKIFINKSYNDDDSSSKNKSKNGDKNDTFSKSVLKTQQKISQI